jgi:hypothetical protein
VRIDISEDPAGPRWLSWFLEQMVYVCLMAHVIDLYYGRWYLAGESACFVLLNACNAYFNRLPISARMHILRRVQFWRRGAIS